MTEMKSVGRNEPCPCGSGKKFKKCCGSNSAAPRRGVAEDYWSRYRIRLKTSDQVAGIRKAGVLALDLLDRVEAMIEPGLPTEEIHRFVDSYTREAGAISAPLNYRGYPKSVCVSVNDVICHGIPSVDQILKDGDIVNVDVTPILDGYYADTNKTFFVGTPSAAARKIVDVARESLRLGMESVCPGSSVGDIGYAIQRYAEGAGCSVVREFVGHGVGLDFHERPDIPHYGRRGRGVKFVPGMVFTIEPMINLGQRYSRVLDDDWTAVTVDGSLTAQFEQTLLVTEDGYESLTPFDLGSSNE